MWSRTLALLIRALRVDARLLRSHLLRLALLVCVVCMLWLAHITGFAIGAPGKNFFFQITYINYLFGTLAGALFFGTAITEEKEEGTLGLLRMADIGALPLLIGKSTPRLATVLLILCVQFPFTLLAVTLGGVAWDQVLAAFCTLLAHIVFVGHLGLFWSVVCRNSGRACGLTIITVLLLVIVPPVLSRSLALLPAPADPWLAVLLEQSLAGLRWLTEASAWTRLWEIMGSGFAGGVAGVQVWSNLAAGLLLVLLAWLLFEPFNRNVEQAVTRRGSVLTQVLRLRTARTLRPWRFPIVWKDFHYLAGGPLMWAGKLLGYGPLVLVFLLAMHDWRWSQVNARRFGEALLIVMVFLVLPLELTLLAARIYRSEIKERTWPALMSLPASLPAIAYAKLAGCALGFLPTVLYLWLGSVLSPETLENAVEYLARYPYSIPPWTCFVLLGVLFVHLTVLYSILSNAWAGILMAAVSALIVFVLSISLVFTPMLLLTLARGAAGPPPFDPDTYFAVAFSVVAVFGLGLIVGVHLCIGWRLRVAAAE
jgi:ABC-type transport system involved in multi-copper enzyme maturation permease subunit